MGLGFIALMGGLFFWMFNVPPPRKAARGRGPGEAPRILVPIMDAIQSERAVELACHLRNGQKTDLVLVYVVELPDTLPLDMAIPDLDNMGREALEVGRVVARRYGCDTRTYIVHHRNAAQGVLQVAGKEGVDAIVLGGEWGKTSAEILRHANCEVFLDEVPKVARPIALAVST